MNIWDFFKFFPMFESFWGEKEFYLNLREKALFSKMNKEEIERIAFYQENMSHFRVFKFSGLLREVLNLTIELLYKIVTFPFNFTYFDYSSEPKLNEISVIIFPDNLLPLLLDFELYSLLTQYYLGCKPEDVVTFSSTGSLL